MKSIINLFAAPSDLFEEQKSKPGWIVPFIIVSILGTGFTVTMGALGKSFGIG